MKKLILTRHAKSDWSNRLQKDFDRELNERGLNDATMMGLRLAKRDIKIDNLISSTATRAKQTALLIANEIKYDQNKIDWIDKLYHAPPYIIQEVVLEVDDNFNTILIVCHNNGISDFANSLTGFVTDNMPTCGMMAFDIETETWAGFETAKKTLSFYDYPKMID
jgi:phosphohistidine phosphatase